MNFLKIEFLFYNVNIFKQKKLKFYASFAKNPKKIKLNIIINTYLDKDCDSINSTSSLGITSVN